MRILTVVGNLERRGTQRVAQNFTLGYKQLGHEVAVLAREAGGPRQQPLQAAGIPVWIGGSRLLQTIEQARHFDPEIIHLHRPGLPNRSDAWLMRQLKTPRNRILETNVFGRFDPSPAGELIDVHLHLSLWCLYQWTNWAGRRGQEQPAVVVPNPVDVEAFAPAPLPAVQSFRQQYPDVPENAYLCGRIGNWDAIVFAAFEKLAAVEPSAHLMCVEDDPRLAGVIAQLSPEIRRRIHIVPATVDDSKLAVFYSSLDCLVHGVKIGESFGMVLAEAMACGCPVVTASRPHKSNSQVEVVGHRVGGIVAGSLQALPEALVALWRDKDLRTRVKSVARQKVVERYAVPQVTAMALRVAQIALESTDRAELQQRLQADDHLVTRVGRQEIQDLLSNTFGGPRMAEVALMHLVHYPWIFSAYRRLLALRRPDRWRPPEPPPLT